MTSDRRNPIRVVGRVAVMVAIGAGAYAALEGLDKTLTSLGGAPGPAPGVLPTANAPAPQANDRSGGAWLEQALIRTEQRASVAADVVQAGWIHGRLVETHGVYRRTGAGRERSFSLRLRGNVAGQPTQINRVSNGLFLFTEIDSGGTPEPNRSVTRVDLRKLRSEFRGDDWAPEAGDAIARLAAPLEAMRWGGVPMLLAGLHQSFDFGPAHEMQLRGERVVAMVGRWNADRYRGLLGETTALPRRAPHHAVVALSKETFFPLMVEYRSGDDPMAAAGLADESLLRPSPRPMLKIDFLRPTFDASIPSAEFAYTPPSGSPLRDETDRELRIARAQRARLAAITSDGQRR